MLIHDALDTAQLSVTVLSLLGKDLTILGHQLFEITQNTRRL